jgi:hypothetical protein
VDFSQHQTITLDYGERKRCQEPYRSASPTGQVIRTGISPPRDPLVPFRPPSAPQGAVID